MDMNLYDNLNWEKQGKAGYTKDQLSCGADWAFASVGAIEAAY